MGRKARRGAVERASGHLRLFRQASIVAVAMTGLLLLLVSPADAETREPDAVVAQADAAAPEEEDEGPAANEPAPEDVQDVARATRDEAKGTFQRLWEGLMGRLPRLAVALGFLFAAWVLVRIIKPLLRLTLRNWERANATVALVGIAIWVLALGLAVSVLAGDVRAMVGSIGLVGLALSWALQSPIESFTGWLLNSFRGYYRVGDRVEVGEVVGDVYKIDVLTTTLWEIGSPFRPGFVNAEQPTGRLITFPNSEILNGSVVNFTRDFPYVWDELHIQLANESDLRHAAEVLRQIAQQTVGEQMAEPARAYQQALTDAHLEANVSTEPEVFMALAESWTTVAIRYLVHARERRKWKSQLIVAVAEVMARPEHQSRIISALPRQQLQMLGTDGRPTPLFEPPPNRPRPQP